MMPASPFGRIVRYVTEKEEIVSGIVTAAFAESEVNIHLFPDGVNQAGVTPHVYTVRYAPVDPAGGVTPNTWHWPPRD